MITGIGPVPHVQPRLPHPGRDRARHLDASAEQRVGGDVVQCGGARRRRRGAPEPTVLPHGAGQVGGPRRRLGEVMLDGCAVTVQRGDRRADRPALGLIAAQHRYHRMLLVAVVHQRLGDRMRHHRVCRDLQEQPVAVLSRGLDCLGKPNPAPQIGRPVVGATRRARPAIGQCGRVQRNLRGTRRRQATDQPSQLTGQRVHRRTVEGHVGVDPAHHHACGRPRCHHLVDSVDGARHDGGFRRRADGRNHVRPSCQPALSLVERQPHQRHRAVARHRPEPARTEARDRGAVRKIEHARLHASGDLTDRVPDDRGRRHAPLPQHGGKPHLDGEGQSLDLIRATKLLAGQRLACREAELGAEDAVDLVDHGGESRLGCEEFTPHAGPVRTVTAEHPHRTVLCAFDHRAGHDAWISHLSGQRVQCGHDGVFPASRGKAVGDHRAAHRLGRTAGPHRGRHPVYGERHVAQVLGKPSGLGGEPRLRTRRQRDERRCGGSCLDAGCGIAAGALLEQNVRDRSAVAVAAYRRAPGPVPRQPLFGLGGHPQATGFPVDLRGQRAYPCRGREHPVVQREGGLDQSDDSRAAFEVPGVGLHRSDGAALAATAGAVNRGERGDLDRIAGRSSGAVGFDIADTARGHPRHPAGQPEQVRLRLSVGRHDADGAAVLSDCAAANHRQHAVTVSPRLGETLEHHHACALATPVTVGRRVEGLAAPVRRSGTRDIEYAGQPRSDQRADATGQGKRRLPVAEQLAGLVHGDQGRCTRGVQGHAGPAKVEKVRDTVGHPAQ